MICEVQGRVEGLGGGSLDGRWSDLALGAGPANASFPCSALEIGEVKKRKAGALLQCTYLQQ